MSKFIINNESICADIHSWGASLTNLKLSGIDRSLVVGLKKTDDHVRDTNYLGASIGRYGNRIQYGKVEFNDETLVLEKNDQGLNHLHGGESGFARRHWALVELSQSHVTLAMESPDGDANYPGNLTVHVTYRICEPATLSVEYMATCDHVTPYNVCHHPYFCFVEPDDNVPHYLQVNAEQYLAASEDLVPFGAPEDVKETKFDFRSMSPIGPGSVGRVGFNNTYCLHNSRLGPLSHAASLMGGAVKMELWTTQPGLHVYDSYKLKSPFDAHERQSHRPGRSVCLEAQAWPNSPNRPDYPDAFLRPGETLRQVTEYRFSTESDTAEY